MSEEAKNIWTEESMVKFMSFSFDIKAFLSHVSKSLNLDETLEFQHQNFNGLSNSNYLLTNSTSKYFLRIQSKDDDSGYFSSPEREFKILKLLQDNNLNMGPKNVCLPGVVNDPVDVKEVAKTLKQLHSINWKNLKGNSSILRVDEKYTDSDTELIPFFGKLIDTWIIDVGKEMLTEEEYTSLCQIYKSTLERTQTYLKQRRHFGRDTIVHRDPHALNFISNDGKLTLLDWELCHLDHYSVDVVYFAKTLSVEDEKTFIESYSIPNEDNLAVWLQWCEQLVGAIGFFLNIYKVAKDNNLTLPNIGDHVSIKKKLNGHISRLESKYQDF